MKKLFAMAACVAATMSTSAQPEGITAHTPMVPWGNVAEIIATNDLTQQASSGWELTDAAAQWIVSHYDGADGKTIQQTNRANVWFDYYDEATDTMITTSAEKNWGGYLTVTNKNGSTSGLIVVGKKRYPSFYITATEKAKFYFSGSAGTAGYPQIEVYEVGSETPVITKTGDFALTKSTWDHSTLLIADGLDKSKTYEIVCRTMALNGEEYTYEGGDIVLQVVKLYGDALPITEGKTIMSGIELGGYINAYRELFSGANEFELEGGGKYTITQSIKTGNGITIAGVKAAPATIDASALEENGFIKLEGCEVHAKNAPAEEGGEQTENENYFYMEKVAISNVKINKLAKPLVTDNQKVLVEDLTLDNVLVQFEAGNFNVFNFNNKGYPAALSICNSTLYSLKGAEHTGYFLQTGGRVRDLDNSQNTYKQTISITNSTLSNIAVGQQANNLQGKGQKSLAFTLTNNILYNFGSKATAILRGWQGGQSSASPTMVYGNNTYVITANVTEGEGEGAVTTEQDIICTEWTEKNEDSTFKTGADDTGTQLTTIPFKSDATAFTVAASSQQAKYRTGDPRWLVAYATDEIKFEVDQSENTDFAAVLNEKLKTSEQPKQITISFFEAGEYPLTQEINTTAPITIQNGSEISAGEATIVVNNTMTLGGQIKIDGVNLKAGDNFDAPVISLVGNPYNKESKGDKDWFILNKIQLLNLTVSNLKGQLTQCAENMLLVKEIETKNAQIYMAGKISGSGNTPAIYDFRSNGLPVTWNFVNSTLDANDNCIFSTAGGKKATEYDDNAIQTLNISNSTVLNPVKKAFQHRQNSQKWQRYYLQNSLIVVNNDKPNFVAEMNNGSTSSNPIWIVKGNAFQKLVDGAYVDASDDQNTGDEAEPVLDTVAGDMTFNSLVTPDFGGTFLLAEGVTAPSALGDPRWTINFEENTADGIETVEENVLANGVIYDLQGRRVMNAQKGLYIINGKKVIR